jgi:DNA polymerase III epsilon subunit-like protein
MDERGCHLRPCGETLMRLGVPPALVARVLRMRTVVVSFDTETTGLETLDRVYQIAARAVVDGKTCDFMRLMWFPRSEREFHPEATRTTGMTHEKLMEHKNRGETVTPQQGIADFFEYLRGFPCGVILAACNFTFDLTRLVHEISVVQGGSAVDTFAGARIEAVYDPQRLTRAHLRALFGGSFAQSHMYRVVTGTYLENAHEAMADARALHTLVHAKVFRDRARWSSGCSWYRHGTPYIQSLHNGILQKINQRLGTKRKAA